MSRPNALPHIFMTMGRLAADDARPEREKFQTEIAFIVEMICQLLLAFAIHFH